MRSSRIAGLYEQRYTTDLRTTRHARGRTAVLMVKKRHMISSYTNSELFKF